MKLLESVLDNIGFIKLNCYESYFHMELTSSRNLELGSWRKIAWLRSVITFINWNTVYYSLFGALMLNFFIYKTKSQTEQSEPFSNIKLEILVPFLFLVDLVFRTSGYLPSAYKIWGSCRHEGKEIKDIL